jgi:hypothetical protein
MIENDSLIGSKIKSRVDIIAIKIPIIPIVALCIPSSVLFKTN